MKPIRLIAAAALVSLGVGQGVAQNNQVIRFDTGDSVLAIRTGTSASANLIVDVDCQGVSSYDITLFYDASRIHVTAATALPGTNMSDPTITLGTDSARLVSNGGTGYVACGPSPFVNVTFAMSGGATTGSLVSIRVSHMIDGVSQDVTPFVATELLDVCQGIHSWGDLDDSGVITSRDALIALTAAVGLPTPGFIAANADVDGDSAVTARDALFILSDGIGLGAGGTRVGQGIANKCAPRAPAPSDMLYWSAAGLNLVAQGDTVPTLVPLPTQPNPFGFNVFRAARMNPAGTRIAYQCVTSNQSDICTVDRSGANIHQLSLFSAGEGLFDPQWSPDGKKLAFLRESAEDPFPVSVWTTDTSGANAHVVGATTGACYLGGWNPAGTKLLYSSSATDCFSHPFQALVTDTVVSGGSITEAFNSGSGGTIAHDPLSPTWRQVVGADSIAYVDRVSNVLSIVAASSAGGPTRDIRLRGASDTPVWLSSGIAFTSDDNATHLDVYLQLPTGRILRLTKSTNATAPTGGLSLR